jgi:hypothetical protein
MSSTVTAKAIFSTNLGATQPRPLIPPLPPVIVRSTPRTSAAQLAIRLRKDFPTESYGVFPGFKVDDYYDPYDIHLQGPHFLAFALGLLAQENMKLVFEFATQWSLNNRDRLSSLCNPITPEEVFDEQSLEKYGLTFLAIALRHMRDSLAALSEQQHNVGHVEKEPHFTEIVEKKTLDSGPHSRNAVNKSKPDRFEVKPRADENTLTVKRVRPFENENKTTQPEQGSKGRPLNFFIG